MAANGAFIQTHSLFRVAADDQHYVGQREFGAYSFNPVLSADLRQFGFHKAQLNINGQIQQSSWDPAQPYAATVSSLYLYKEFGEDRAELKIGYITTDFQFIGLQVGGQVASGAQGVYAVLPYEVGLSYSPIPAPAITLRYRLNQGFYLKGAAQRAAQPGSLQDALRRDAVGLRFLPHGDRLVLVGEGKKTRCVCRHSGLLVSCRLHRQQYALPEPAHGTTKDRQLLRLLARETSKSGNPSQRFPAAAFSQEGQPWLFPPTCSMCTGSTTRLASITPLPFATDPVTSPSIVASYTGLLARTRSETSRLQENPTGARSRGLSHRKLHCTHGERHIRCPWPQLRQRTVCDSEGPLRPLTFTRTNFLVLLRRWNPGRVISSSGKIDL